MERGNVSVATRTSAIMQCTTNTPHKRCCNDSTVDGVATALTLWEFRTAQVPRVHCDVRPTSRVKTDFITLDDNTSRLGLHSVAHGLKLRGEAPWYQKVCTRNSAKIQEVGLHHAGETVSGGTYPRDWNGIRRNCLLHIGSRLLDQIKLHLTCTEHTLKTSGMSLLNSSKQPHAPDEANPVKRMPQQSAGRQMRKI